MKNTILILAITIISSMTVSAQNYKLFGEKFEASKPLEATKLSKKTVKGQSEMQVQGEVESVCQAAGCWMKVKLADGQTMRVTFKDYGFFVPKDLAGTKVIFDGTPQIVETSVSDLKHYAADAGKSQKEIDEIKEPKVELTFVANGVLVPAK